MSTPANEFADYCAELLAPLGPVRIKRMFGGHGLYVDELFIAILSSERLYLKTDAINRASFEAAGCEPFHYEARGKRHTIAYYSPPGEALESAGLMQPWARLALEAALRARATASPALKKRVARSAAAKRSGGAKV